MRESTCQPWVVVVGVSRAGKGGCGRPMRSLFFFFVARPFARTLPLPLSTSPPPLSSFPPSDINKPAGAAPPPPAATATVTLADGGPASSSPTAKAAAHPATAQTTQQAAQAGEAAAAHLPPTAKNNYARPAGQNVGNFLTDRPSSRVLAPPGGGSQITFG